MKFKTIEEIALRGLCTGCGACVTVCETNAITMKNTVSGFLFASLDQSKCINCKKCVAVCPSIVQIKEVNTEPNPLEGKFINAYIGRAKSDDICQKGQSGGVVTACLLFLLQNKLIDGAYVNHFDESTQKNEVVFATSEQELINGAGSYYVQSAVCEPFFEKKEKVAAVTLGCQSQAFKLLKNRPDYILGLFCAGQYSKNYYQKLAKKREIQKFRFRDKEKGGWPGDVSYISDDKQYVINKKTRHYYKEFYEAHRCLLCFDQMNLLSDVCFGDPWGIDYNNIKQGYTVFITRTEKGESLIKQAIAEQFIVADKIQIEDVVSGQTVNTRHKNKFIVVNKYYNKNNLYFPYDGLLNDDNDDLYNKIPKHFKRTIEKRLKFSKKLYGSSKNKMNLLMFQKHICTFFERRLLLAAKVFKRLLMFRRKDVNGIK